MKHLKLMNEFCCWPIWNIDPEEYGNINPTTLPISVELQERLLEWARTYDAIFNGDDPANSAFPTVSEEVEFKHEGYLLAEALKNELGEDYEVETRII